MLFTDEAARHKYHTSSTLLQVVCQMVESELAPHHMQLELVDIELQDDFWVGLLVVATERFEESQDMQDAFRVAAHEINKRFMRYDGKNTTTVECGSLGLLTIRVSDSQAFAQVN